MSGRSQDAQQLSTSLTLGLGLLAATMTLLTAGSVGVLGFVLGKQQQQPASKKRSSADDDSSDDGEDPFRAPTKSSPRRLRIPSGTASEDVKISDKQAIVDVRITGIRPLIPPACLLEEIPLTTKMAQTVRLSVAQ